MIEVNNITKKFGSFTALDNVTCTIPEGCIYGMVGSNGAGKSTLLRLISGVYRPDAGEVLIDGEPVWENETVKAQIGFVPDELYFLSGASMTRMAELYKAAFPRFDQKRFRELADAFGLDTKKSIGTFSKGMKRQASTALALACRPKYLFFDETFDGLDPIMRTLVKKTHLQRRDRAKSHRGHHLPLPAGAGGYLRSAGAVAQGRTGAAKRRAKPQNLPFQGADRLQP